MDNWLEISAADAPEGRLERKLVESAHKHVGDERVRVVLRGQTSISPLVLPLLGSLLFFLVKPRTVIVTDKSVITVQESIFQQSKVARLVSHYPAGDVPIRRTRLGLKVGEDATIFAVPGSLAALDRAVAAATGASA